MRCARSIASNPTQRGEKKLSAFSGQPNTDTTAMIVVSMIDNESIMDVLREIADPEMPISIVDLGLVEGIRLEANGEAPDGIGTRRASVSIDILPTFVGCPALPMIEDEIKMKVGQLDGISAVSVHFVHDPPWSVDRISDAGRESLAAHGVTVPEQGSSLAIPGHGSPVQLRTSAIACPFCASANTRMESQFGPTRCRMIYYCESCKNSFEHMKRV